MGYLPLNVDNGTEIQSLEDYIERISELGNNKQNEDGTLYFRGQEADFWKIEPSVFRNDMLSVEHTLILEPRRIIPGEFHGLINDFEILEKCQHYGMCTRLLDITSNPLVALYFACAEHEEEKYEENGAVFNNKPNGVIYFREENSAIYSNDRRVKIILTLAKNDVTNLHIEDALCLLVNDNVITSEQKEKWLSEDGIIEFVHTVQSVYTVLPVCSNERLVRQSGAFLLPGKFNLTVDGDDIKNGFISKSEASLRDEFNNSFFYVLDENKEKIRKQLNECNINSASLFPELEYQLKYIQNENSNNTRVISYFEKFQGFSIKADSLQNVKDTFDSKAMELRLKKIINNSRITSEILAVINQNQSVDWIRKESILSKIKMEIRKVLLKNGYESVKAEQTAEIIKKNLLEVQKA